MGPMGFPMASMLSAMVFLPSCWQTEKLLFSVGVYCRRSAINRSALYEFSSG
jgi:hypothetical protein